MTAPDIKDATEQELDQLRARANRAEADVRMMLDEIFEVSGIKYDNALVAALHLKNLIGNLKADIAVAEYGRKRAEAAIWQPLETAPRDGTRIILWFARTKIDKGEAVEGFFDKVLDGTWMVSRGASFMDRRLRQPTHWMPLPGGPDAGDGR
jgi:hypothetical protein